MSKNKRVLVIEGSDKSAQKLKRYFERENFEIDLISHACEGFNFALQNEYSIIVYNYVLSPTVGMEVLRCLQKQNRIDARILVIVANDVPIAQVATLDLGADGFLTAGFEVDELDALVKMVLCQSQLPGTLQVADLSLNTRTMMVKRSAQTICLTPISLKILKILMKESPKMVTRNQLACEIWGDILPEGDALRSHIYNLRKKIDGPFAKSLLQTVQSQGYRIGDSA